MYKEKINIIVPSDSFLFDGGDDAVEQGWKDSVGVTIKTFFESSGKEISDEEIKEYGDDVLSARREELARHAKNPEGVKYPKNILTTSYAILEKYLGTNAAAEMAVIGNTEYLSAYMKAAESMVSVSEEGKALFVAVRDKIAEGHEVTLVRCEHKRKDPMVQETEKLKDIAKTMDVPDFEIIHSSLNQEGSAYLQPLPIIEEGVGINIFIASPETVDKKTDEFYKQLAKAAEESNLLIMSVDEKSTRKEISATAVGEVASAPVVNIKPDEIGNYLSSEAIHKAIMLDKYPGVSRSREL